MPAASHKRGTSRNHHHEEAGRQAVVNAKIARNQLRLHHYLAARSNESASGETPHTTELWQNKQRIFQPTEICASIAMEPITLSFVPRPPAYTSWVPCRQSWLIRPFQPCLPPPRCLVAAQEPREGAEAQTETTFLDINDVHPQRTSSPGAPNPPDARKFSSIERMFVLLETPPDQGKNMLHTLKQLAQTEWTKSGHLQEENSSMPLCRDTLSKVKGSTLGEAATPPCRQSKSNKAINACFSIQQLSSIEKIHECQLRWDIQRAASSVSILHVLFCRRCFLFGCRTHNLEDSQLPHVKQRPWTPQNVPATCGEHCFRHQQLGTGLPNAFFKGNSSHLRSKSMQVAVTGKNIKLTEGAANWSEFERRLYKQGAQIFGENSCVIAKNMLKGLRMCAEVEEFKREAEATKLSSEEGDECRVSEDSTSGAPPQRRGRKSKGLKMRRSEMQQRRSGELLRRYSPCGCTGACSSSCACIANETYCEKFCACYKAACSNRFKGCFCRKTLCWQSAHCACFMAGRECDPDTCRNCSLPCVDGATSACGEGITCWKDGTMAASEEKRHRASLPRQRCQNMNLLQNRGQRLLLSRSKVAGWGAFLRKAAIKHTYIGEYVGELISHEEADKRGSLEGREGSYLFDLNNELVIDAYRHGNKTKFINHSSDPNCYALVLMVRGDHRIGFFAKRDIETGEELFFNYFLRGSIEHLSWAGSVETTKTQDERGGR